MKVYLVIVKDRHCDLGVDVFASEDDAIERCENIAIEYCRHDEDLKQVDVPGTLLHIKYSCENDYVEVLEREIQ